MRRVVLTFLFLAVTTSGALAQSGRVESRSFTGPVTGTQVNFSIYLPPGYDQSTESYPVVYHLHGLGGRHDGNQTRSVPASFEASTRQGLIGPVIIVFPDGLTDSMWSDSVDLSQPAETNLIHELIPHVDATFRTRGTWEYRMIEGFSMGGFGAAKLAAKFPQLFCAAIVYDGALHRWNSLVTNRPTITTRVFGDDPDYFDMHSPYAWTEVHAERLRYGVPMRVVVGELTDYGRDFRDHMQNLAMPVDYVETGLGHNLAALLLREGANSARFLQEAFPLEGSWSFDETSGNTLHDDSLNGFDGTSINAPRWTPGVRGNALSFDGTNQYVEISDGNGHPDAIGDLATGTISLWFQFHTLTATDEIHPILYLGDGIGGSGNSSLILEVGHFNAGNSKVYFTVLWDDTQIRLCFDSSFPLVPHRWYEVTVVIGPHGNRGYLDGEEMIANAPQPPARHFNFGNETIRQFFADVVDKRVFWIGRGFLGDRTNDQYLTGQVDELRIYDRPLCAAQVRELHDRTAYGIDVLGNGTPGSAHIVPALHSVGGPPAIGNASFGLELADGLGGAPALLILGAQRGGLPVPAFNLNLQTLPPWISLPGVLQGNPLPGTGRLVMRLPIPVDTNLVGFELIGQGFVADLGTAKGGSATMGLRVRIR